MANKEEIHVEATKPDKEDVTEFNKGDIERLKSLRNSLEKSSGSCSLAKAGMCLMTNSFKVSNTKQLGRWVVDSGATDHMTHNDTLFDSYNHALVKSKNYCSKWFFH